MKIKREGDRELYVQIKIVFKNRYYRDRFVELLKKIAEKSILGSGGMSKLRGLSSARYILTRKGRSLITVVLAGGVFDILHPGHVAFLKDAKTHGDCLVVVIARDSTVRKRKGRPPTNPERDRLLVVSSLKHVDLAILGSEEGFEKTLEKVRPDIIFLGYDQHRDVMKIKQVLKNRGGKIIASDNYLPGYSTSSIMRSIRSDSR